MERDFSDRLRDEIQALVKRDLAPLVEKVITKRLHLYAMEIKQQLGDQETKEEFVTRVAAAIRSRANDRGTIMTHGEAFAAGLRCAANMLEKKS